MYDFCERLKHIRKKRGLTQLEVCKAITKLGNFNMQKTSAWSCYEAGVKYPNACKLRDICVVLNVSADYLLGLSDKEDLK